jgi:hypothetical protein
VSFYNLLKNVLKILLFNGIDELPFDVDPMKIKHFDMWKALYFELFGATVYH